MLTAIRILLDHAANATGARRVRLLAVADFAIREVPFDHPAVEAAVKRLAELSQPGPVLGEGFPPR